MTRQTVAGSVVAVALGVAGLVGLGVQVIGQPANHPQLEAAHAAVSRLDGGDQPRAVVPGGTVDIARSNDLFVIVTDPAGNVLASSANVSGATVLPPPGVFDYVRKNGEDRVTWQPVDGVRSWIVVDSFNGGFVIAGRSPTGVEQNGYVLLLWGSFAAIGLALAVGIATAVKRVSGR